MVIQHKWIPVTIRGSRYGNGDWHITIWKWLITVSIWGLRSSGSLFPYGDQRMETGIDPKKINPDQQDKTSNQNNQSWLGDVSNGTHAASASASSNAWDDANSCLDVNGGMSSKIGSSVSTDLTLLAPKMWILKAINKRTSNKWCVMKKWLDSKRRDRNIDPQQKRFHSPTTTNNFWSSLQNFCFSCRLLCTL